MLRIANSSLELFLNEPENGFYRGTRFDRSGVWGGVLWRGVQLAGRWFERYDPFAHDAVLGPAEEFSPIGFDSAAPGGTFLKIGVGMLRRPDSAPYDRFRLYEIADPGEWEAGCLSDAVYFRHRLGDTYRYEKEIVLTGPDSFEIRHSLEAPAGPLEVEVYNHNFWTLGRIATGPSRLLDFPFRPEGDWRAGYDSVAFTPSGIRFSRPLAAGESVYCGNVHEAGTPGMPYRLSVADAGVRVSVEGSAPVTHTVFWSNHRVACLEPYNRFTTPCSWWIRYTFSDR